MSDQTIPVVAIIGRPNVGKSTLFNRLLKKRRALVDATPGVTRDRLYGDLQWQGVHFRVVDTGGLQFDSRDRLGERVALQVSKAMEEASLALLVGDGREGPMPLDREVASWLRPWGKPVLVVVNKVDSDRELPASYEFSSLGFGEPLGVSASHGRGIGELLDAVARRLPLGSGTVGSGTVGSGTIRVAIVGRPNVGKSSLVNRIANEERVLVDEAPGTTRDPVEVTVSYQERPYCLIDTAGVRSKRRLNSRVDAVARIKALEVIHGVDVCL
ncbi:MAG: ribosome biogenesis GTPase Der [Candidatus Omnitrophica bacterium]|nr:ribosome biogenesis GTPase Der [Candidatus Omnitrophota bacterium]